MCDINIGLHVVEVLVNSYDTWHGMVVFQQHIMLLAINVYFDDA